MITIDWEDIEMLESIANRSIYEGRDVGRARAALKAIHGYDVIYEDELEDDGNNNSKGPQTNQCF
jgi:hypothetical protein